MSEEELKKKEHFLILIKNLSSTTQNAHTYIKKHTDK